MDIPFTSLEYHRLGSQGIGPISLGVRSCILNADSIRVNYSLRLNPSVAIQYKLGGILLFMVAICQMR